MKTIQQYFNTTFNKSDKVITISKINEKLQGNILTLENYPELELLDVKELEQVEEIIIVNCPRLKNIKYSNKEQKPLIIQPSKSCDWRCFAIAGLLVWNILLSYFVIRQMKRIKEHQKNKNKL